MLLRLLRARLAPYRRPLVYVIVLQLASTIAMLYLPSLNADIIDRGIATGDTTYILHTGGVMLLISLAQILASAAAVFFGARVAMGFGRDVRQAIFARVQTFSSREVNRFGAPTLITRCTNDVQQVQTLVVLTCTMLVGAPIMCIGGVFMALREDPGLSWLMAVCVPVLVVLLGLIIRRMVPQFRRMQSRVDVVNRVLREQIGGVRVVRAFVREPYEQQRFGRANGELTDTAVHVGRLQALIFPTVMLVLNVSSVAVLWFGAHRVDSGAIEVGSLTAFLSYLMQILMSVMMATFMLMMVPRAAVSAERISEVLDTESSVLPPVAPVQPEADVHGQVEFRDVSFAFPGAAEPVLRHVSLTARPGTTTAIVGSTGAGKSTLVSLVPRLSDVSDGTVLVDGVDVRDLDEHELWARIGMVPQKPYLFTGTVASNLRYGNPDASDEQLWQCLRVAQAAEFVERMPGELDAPIAQGGTNVSGGQRQRLAIARALVRRPEIYLFDDSFSALDVATDARLRVALRSVTANAAVIVVAQRVSSVVHAEQILVLEDGAVVGRGTHAELLADCPTYAEIVESQLSADDSALVSGGLR